MKSKLAASLLVAVALLLPVAGYTADSDSDRSSPKKFVKNSIITTKIKAELFEERMASLLHVHVDTDKSGIVVLSGTTENQAAADKANSIARNVKGVTSVENNIRVKSN